MLRLALAAGLVLAAAAAEASHQVTPLPLREAGVLTCKLDDGAGIVAGTSRSMTCAFDRVGLPGPERYAGYLDRARDDIGSQVMSWVVWTPGGFSRDRMLTGVFMAAPTGTYVTAGASAQPLRSEQAEDVVLRPLAPFGQAALDQSFPDQIELHAPSGRVG